MELNAEQIMGILDKMDFFQGQSWRAMNNERIDSL